MAAPVLRPRSVAEIVDASFQLARSHFMPLLVLSALVAIPSLIIGAMNVWLLPTANPEDASVGASLASIPLSIVSACWSVIGYGAVTLAASDAYLGGTPDGGHSLKRALRRAHALILGNLLGYLIMMVPFIAAGVLMAIFVGGTAAAAGEPPTGPGGAMALVALALIGFGIYWAIRVLPSLMLVTPVAALESAGPQGTWERAKTLASGSRKSILAVVLIAGVAVIGLIIGGYAIVAIFTDNEALAGVLSGVVAIPLWPVLGSLFVVLYYDLRIRKEAFDLEVMAAGLGARDTAEAGGPARM